MQLCNQVAEAHSDRFVPLLERVVDRLHLKVIHALTHNRHPLLNPSLLSGQRS